MDKVEQTFHKHTSGKRFQGKAAVSDVLAGGIALLAVLALWQLICTLELVPHYLLPSPVDVVKALVGDWPLLLSHAQTTLVEALLGLALGAVLGFLIAYGRERYRMVDKALRPLIILTQTIPTVAIAPLLVLWLGYDMTPKVVLVTLTTFFPITVALTSGFQSVDPDCVDLMRTFSATQRQIFTYVKVPQALESGFSGLEISATYAIVAAVVSEWLGGFSGLGVYMTRVRKSFAYDRMFASILLIAVLSLVLMLFIRILKRICIPWRNRS